MTRAECRAKWEERVAMQAASGQSIGKWCKENNVCRRQMHLWRRRFRDEASEARLGEGWVQVSVPDTAVGPVDSGHGAGQLTIRIGRYSIDVPDGVSSELLAEVVRVVTAQC